jgi:hypothetical protein
MELGTYTTIDCPCCLLKEDSLIVQQRALAFLENEFNKIGANVRKIMNPHDFCDYPSFEIDYPNWYEMTSLNLDFEDDTTDLEGDRKRINDWDDKANKIEEEYNKKFEKYL